LIFHSQSCFFLRILLCFFFVLQILVYESQLISSVWYSFVAFLCSFQSCWCDLAICVHFAFIFPKQITLAGYCKHAAEQFMGDCCWLAELAELWAVTYGTLFWQLGSCLMCYRRQPPAVPTQQPHWDAHAHLRERQPDLLKVSLRRLHTDSHLRRWKTVWFKQNSSPDGLFAVCCHAAEVCSCSVHMLMFEIWVSFSSLIGLNKKTFGLCK